jgi:hypothetical protein
MYIDHGSTFTHKSFLSPSVNFTISHSLHVIHALAQNVRGIREPNSGHWIPEEWINFVRKLLDNFFWL